MMTLLFFMAFSLHSGECHAESSALERMDSVDISLLTVGPGNEVWSLYGHTALRYQDKIRKQDIAVNYGSFSFDQDYFILRFIFGATDYEMTMLPMRLFMQEYQMEKRWVVEQKLNLTREEKLEITNALYQNSLPENVTYRYNFFYDNCTTRAMDMIINHLNTDIHISDNQWNGESYRSMTHQWTENHRWYQFGNDLLLGICSDFKTDKTASFFLPDSVRKVFDHIVLTREDGIVEPLVYQKDYLITPQEMKEQQQDSAKALSFLTPWCIFCTLLMVVFFITLLLQWWQKHNLWLLDAMLLFISGVAGLVLFVMIFSQHPTVRVNLQILLLNPLSLIFLYPTLKTERLGYIHWYWKVLLCCIILFLIGGFWQIYAEGMYLLALCLLIRCMTNIRMLKATGKTPASKKQGKCAVLRK